MQHTLENDRFRAIINSRGAELVSLVKKDENLEYIWQADPNIWPRHTPVLFPIVGRLLKDQYTYQGHTYSMSQHGFARDMVFAKEATEEEDTLVMELTETPETLQKYPFRFRFQVKFVLMDNRLEVHYEVENTDIKELFFSVGAHPAFRCPLKPTETFADYYLEFKQEEKLERYQLDNGLQTGKTEKVSTKGRMLPLNHELFRQDALVFKNLKSDVLTLRSDQNNHSIKVEFKGFLYLGIWSKGDGDFLCIEPWLGIAGAVDGPEDLAEKEGIIKLQPQEIFGCMHAIEVG